MLIPFDSKFAQKAFLFYRSDPYSHFHRETRRFFTLDECGRLPQVLGQEILFVIDCYANVFGMVTLLEDPRDVYTFGIAIETEAQNKKLGSDALVEIEDYVFNRKGGRMLMTHILMVDDFLEKSLVKKGYQKFGMIPKYNFIGGKFEDVAIFGKEKNYG